MRPFRDGYSRTGAFRIGNAGFPSDRADLARIEEALPPVAGTRHGEDQMKILDSER
jgi:hypothetical protein